MKPQNYFTIFISASRWRVARCRETDLQWRDVTGESAGPAAAALKELDYRGEGVVVALASLDCLSAPVSLTGLPRAQRYQGLVFRLEESLCVPAEQLTAEFILGYSEALGVAVETAALKPILDKLENAGIAIQAVCPAALLAVHYAQTANLFSPKFSPSSKTPAQSAAAVDDTRVTDNVDAILWGDGESVDLIRLSNGRPAVWHHLPAVAEDLALPLKLWSETLDQPLKLATFSLPPAILQHLSSLPGLSVVSSRDVLLDEAAAQGACDALDGRARPVPDLRRGDLAAPDVLRRLRRPLHAALGSAACLLVCLSSVCLWRSHRYDLAVSQSIAAQTEAFRAAFPNRTPGAAPLSRLVSEERRLRGESGADSGLPQRMPGLNLLYDLLASLPPGLRYRVLELRLGDGRLVLEGQARFHSDAEAIAATIGHSGAFIVDPPKSEQLDDKGVAFTLTAAVRTDAPQSPSREVLTARREGP